MGCIPRVPLTWLEKRSTSRRRSRSPSPGPSQDSRPMVTLSGLLSSRSPALSMVILRLWGNSCPEQEGRHGDTHRGPGQWGGSGRGLPSCPQDFLVWPLVGSPLNLLGFSFLSQLEPKLTYQYLLIPALFIK